MTPPPPPSQAKVEGAAKQFEALLIAQMLRTARENSSPQSSATSSMQDMADQQFSQLLANNGGFGLTKMIIKGLNQTQANIDHKQAAPIRP